MKNKTFAIIKPDAIEAKNCGSILSVIEKNNFEIVWLKFLQLTPKQAQAFYSVHEGKPFFQSLCQYMSSNKIMAMVLKKENAVTSFRKLIGNTDPKKAEKGTIRNMFATSIEANAIHGSDSDENAEIEINFFFSQIERIY